MEPVAMGQRATSAHLGRDDHTALHIRMEPAKIIDRTGFIQHHPGGLLRPNYDIPVFVGGGSGVREGVLIDPLDCIADLGGNFRRRIN